MLIAAGENVAEYLGRRLGITFHPPYYAVAYGTDTGRPLAAVLWNDYSGRNGSIEINIAVEPGGLTRGVLHSLADYAFVLNDCRRVQAHVKRSNKPMLKLMKRLGFTYESSAPCYYPDDDAVVFRMLRSTCRWIKNDARRSDPIAA